MGIIRTLYGLSNISLSLLTGVLLTIAWPAIGGAAPLVLFAFIPMLIMEDKRFRARQSNKAKGIFWPAFLGFLLFNIGTTYFILYIREPEAGPIGEWVSKLTAAGLTYVLNSAFMAIVVWLFHDTRRRLGDNPGYIGLVMFWMAFEFLHMHWSINWPWLNLGNAFAGWTSWIQWYEYTGSMGATAWILVMNLLLFAIVRRAHDRQPSPKRWWVLALILFIVPTAWSFFRYSAHAEVGESVEVVVVQPDMDPYGEKFTIPAMTQLELMLNLADSAMSPSTRFIVLPETALQEQTFIRGDEEKGFTFHGMWAHRYEKSLSVRRIRRWLDLHPDVAMVAGAADRAFYPEKATPSARYIENLDIYYDSFNSTWLIDEDGVQADYRKSKLVPGVESLPFATLLAFIDDLALDLGGTSGSLGIQAEREVFQYDGYTLAPTICYESVFGEFNTAFVQQGAQAIFVSTNDSWWQDSPGYRQLLMYGQLRAIETRKGIARSANTGISCFIDQKGDVVSSLPWLSTGALRGEVYFNDVETFYSRHGDFLNRVAALFSALLLLWARVRPLKEA